MKLSIITVNLNNLEGLKKTYESVVSQTFTDYEWLVIDGGSTDGSREFIEQHQDKFAYWCSEPDKGIYNAMNKGIVKAKGEYLNFMNSGDCFASVETLAGVFEKERTVDILYGYSCIGSLKKRIVHPTTMKYKLQWHDLYYGSLPHQSSFIKRERFFDVGLYDETCRIVSDWKWFVSAILNYKATYEFIPYIISIMQDAGISLSEKCSLESQQQRGVIFPNYITNDDIHDLRKISIIQSYRLSRFLFRIAIVIALRIKKYKQDNIYQRLSTKIERLQ